MDKKKINLSVALAVRNEEKNLSACLSGISDIADEIVVVDGGSTDKTVSIAKTYKSTVIIAKNEPMFHINKQKALDHCHGDWILQLDADEVVTEELRKEIIWTISNKQEANGYFIPRKNYFWGHFMKKGGQYPDYVIRLVKNGNARFPCKTVHEQIKVLGNVGYLKTPLLHYSYKTIGDYWRKADAYTTLRAEHMKKNGLQKGVRLWISYNLEKPVKTFLNLFIRHKGFVDGVYGLLFAYFSALDYPIAYRKFKK